MSVFAALFFTTVITNMAQPIDFTDDSVIEKFKVSLAYKSCTMSLEDCITVYDYLQNSAAQLTFILSYANLFYCTTFYIIVLYIPEEIIRPFVERLG